MPSGANYYRGHGDDIIDPATSTTRALVDIVDTEDEEDAAFDGDQAGTITIQSGYTGTYLFAFTSAGTRSSTDGNDATENSNDFYNVTNSGSCLSDIWIKATDLVNGTDEIIYTNVSFNNNGLFDNLSLIESSDIFVLAVKPNHAEDILDSIRGLINENKLVISIMAGVKIDKIKSNEPTH